MPEWVLYLSLVAVGCVAGTLNVLAGGGSFLTLPMLIFMGLPATVANGTNRVGILLQNVGAVWGFNRKRVLDWRWAAWTAVPATVGAVAGTVVALHLGDASFKKVLAVLMIAVTLWTLLDPLKRWHPDEAARPKPLVLAAGFFVVGIYGGFVQAGVGFLILAATTLAGLDLVRGNAVKVLSIMAFTMVSLAIFAWSGNVRWIPGLALAAGTVLGGQLGVHLTVLKGHAFVKVVVTVAVLVFAVKLLL